MSKNLLYPLWGFFAVLSLTRAETDQNTHQQKKVPPPADRPFFSEDRRKEILAEQLKFIQSQLKEAPNKDVPMARIREEKTQKEVIEKLQNSGTSTPIVFKAEEVTKFTPRQAEIAIQSVMRDNRMSDEFAEYTKNVNLENAVDVLKDIGAMQKTELQTVSASQKAAVYLPDESARIAYLAAAFKLKKDAERLEAKPDPEAEAKAKAAQSSQNLSSSLFPNLSSGYTASEKNFGRSNLPSIAGGYLDIAGKQIANAINSRSSRSGNDTSLRTPFGGSSELSKKFADAINSVNSLDLLKGNVSSKIKPFKELINSKDFLEYGSKLLGEANANALVSAVQAAELLSENADKLNADATEYLAGAFNFGTGIAAPPCIGCVEIKNSPLVKDAATFVALGELPDSETQEWIEEARIISDYAGKDKSADPKYVAALVKGRIELEQILILLDKYKSQGVLKFVTEAEKHSMSQIYKHAAETAAGVLFIVKNKKIKEGTSHKTNFKISLIKKSANKLLNEMKTAKNPQNMETTLRNFFEKGSYEEARSLWRDFELENYLKLRSLTAQIITARAFSALRDPSFEKITVERAALANLVNKSLLQVKERKIKELKEQQIRLGIMQLPEIKMADEKKTNEKLEKDIPIDRFPGGFSEDTP